MVCGFFPMLVLTPYLGLPAWIFLLASPPPPDSTVHILAEVKSVLESRASLPVAFSAPLTYL